MIQPTIPRAVERWRAARRAVGWLATAALAASIALGAHATARAQTLLVELPPGCGDADAVRARLGELGVSEQEDATISMSAGPGWAGLVRGELRVEQRGQVVERTIEDDACADVRDALTIAAALALRELRESAGAPVDHGPDELVLRLGERDGPARPRARTPTGPVIAGAIGLEGRLGRGPVPGVSIAPGLLGALSVDAFLLAGHVVLWPESAAGVPGSAHTASLWGLVGTLEVGARTPGPVGALVSAVLEVGVASARGQGVEGASDVTAGIVDAGVAIGLDARIGPTSVFLRTDLLLALVRPSYLVGDAVAFEVPALRAALSVGVLFWPGS